MGTVELEAHEDDSQAHTDQSDRDDGQVEVSGEQETDEQERSHTLLDHHGEQQGQAVGGHDLGRNVKTSGQPLGNHVDDGLNQVGANKDGEEDRQEVHDGVQTRAGADVHTVSGLELSVIDRAICHMGEGGDDGTEHDAEELTQDGDRDGDRHGGLGGSIGQARKGSGHDAAQDHIGRNGGADLHQAHGHELDGGTDGKAGGHIAQQQTDERSANEGLLEVKTTEQAGVPHAEHADEADEHRTDERIHTLLLSVRQKPG